MLYNQPSKLRIIYPTVTKTGLLMAAINGIVMLDDKVMLVQVNNYDL